MGHCRLVVIEPGEPLQRHKKAKRVWPKMVATHVNKGKVYPYSSLRQTVGGRRDDNERYRPLLVQLAEDKPIAGWLKYVISGAALLGLLKSDRGLGRGKATRRP